LSDLQKEMMAETIVEQGKLDSGIDNTVNFSIDDFYTMIPSIVHT